MMEEERSKIFVMLRPLCIKVLRTPSRQTIDELNSMVNELTSIDPKLVEYVVFPLRVSLKQPNMDPVLIERLVTCVTSVVTRSTILSRELFEELFRLSCVLLDEKLIKQRYEKLSYTEDIIYVALRMLLAVLQNSSHELMIGLLSGGQQLPVVGHCVSTLLSVIQHQTFKDVQLTAMDCLAALSGMHSSMLSLLSAIALDSEDVDISWVKDPSTIGSGLAGASATFSSFLPGIVVSFCELVTKDSKAGQKVISSGLLIWVHFVSLVMNNGEHDAAINCGRTENDVSDGEHDKRLEVKRDKKWWKETSQKLNVLITRISQLMSHTSWLVRCTLCAWSYYLLTHCSDVLTLSTSKCFEVLITLQSDCIPVVSSTSSILLQTYSDRFVTSNSGSLISTFEENIFNLCSSLSKSLLSLGDEQKLCTLKLLLGYVKLLGPHISGLSYSVSHLKALCLGLAKCLQLELSDIRIMEEQQVNIQQDGFMRWTLPLRFVHFQNHEIFHCIEEICLYVGCHVQLEPVIDQLMEIFCSLELHRKEAVLVIKNVMLGATGTLSPVTLDRHDLLIQQVKELIAEFTSPNHWQCRTSSGTEVESSPHKDGVLSFKQLNSNVLLVCLLVQCVGTFAQVVGGSFEPLLQTTIYPLMEKLGDHNAMISHCAHHSLSLIAHHCGYASISSLITANADYLVNAVSLNLRSIAVHPEAPTVMKAVLLYGDAEVLPLMQDSIDELMFALDIHQEKEFAFWPVLLTLVKAIVKWFPSKVMHATQAEHRHHNLNDDEEHSKVSSASVREFFINYHKQKLDLQADEETEQSDTSDTTNSTTEPNKKKKLSPHHQAALEVLKRCTYFVATNVLRTKLVVLDAVALGLVALQDVQDELLPQVHKMWPAYIKRFTESNPLVVLKATEVLVTMADVCRDFLRRRVSKEVWPVLMSKLEQLASTSRTAGTNYRHTSSYKLQRTVLDNAALLADKLEMTADDHEKLAHACIPYLDCNQPMELQAKCRNCLEALATSHADLLWLLLQQIRPNQDVQPPHASLKPYKFPPHQASVDYQNIVDIFLGY